MQRLGIRRLITMMDDDEAGIIATRRIKKMAGKEFLIYGVTWRGIEVDGKRCSDPGGTPKEEIEYMLKHKKLLNFSLKQ
jgi:hypothetical protein